MGTHSKINSLKSRVIILAAGNSTRMGSPKALLNLQGKTLLEFQLDALSLQPQKPIVVLGLHSEQILEAIPDLKNKANLAVNRNPELGQFSSLKLALSELNNEATFVLPLDTPAPGSNVWMEIERAIENFSVVVPNFHGRGGHPVWLSADFTEQLLRDGIPNSEQRLDFQIRKIKKELYRAVSVSDPSILIDLDTPEDLSAYLMDFRNN